MRVQGENMRVLANTSIPTWLGFVNSTITWFDPDNSTPDPISICPDAIKAHQTLQRNPESLVAQYLLGVVHNIPRRPYRGVAGLDDLLAIMRRFVAAEIDLAMFGWLGW